MKVLVTFSKSLKLLHGGARSRNVSAAKIESSKSKASRRGSAQETVRDRKVEKSKKNGLGVVISPCKTKRDTDVTERTRKYAWIAFVTDDSKKLICRSFGPPHIPAN